MRCPRNRGAVKRGWLYPRLLEREADLQGHLVVVNLAISDVAANFATSNQSRWRSDPEAVVMAPSMALEMLVSDVPTISGGGLEDCQVCMDQG